MSINQGRPRPKGWFQRLRDSLRGSLHTEGTLQVPTGQHYQESDEDRFRREHGYSQATAPDEWTADIRKHNVALDKEYNDEIATRQRLTATGAYRPRFIMPLLTDVERAHADSLPDDAAWTYKAERQLARLQEIRRGAVPAIEEVNWHLEVSTDPGRRTDVTKEPGVPMQPHLSAEEVQQAREAGHLGRVIAGIERADVDAQLEGRMRAMVGPRDKLVAFLGGNEALADQVEAKAYQTLATLDTPAVNTPAVKKREVTEPEKAFDKAVKGLHTDDGYWLKDKDGKTVGIID